MAVEQIIPSDETTTNEVVGNKVQQQVQLEEMIVENGAIVEDNAKANNNNNILISDVVVTENNQLEEPMVPGWYSHFLEFWPGEAQLFKVDKVLFTGKSKYQDFFIFENAKYGKMMILDNSLQLSEKDEWAYQEMLTHLPLCSIPNPKKLLLIGGGDGGILREASRHQSLEQIDICELDELLVELYKTMFPDIAIGYKDPRVRLYFDDGENFLKSVPQGTYDVVILDAFTEMGPGAEVVVDEGFLETVAKTLRPGGVLCTPANSFWKDGFEPENYINLCRKIFKGSVNYAWGSVPVYKSGIVGYMLCSTAGPPVDFKHPINQLDENENSGIANKPLQYYNSEVHTAAFCLPTFVRRQKKNESTMATVAHAYSCL